MQQVAAEAARVAAMKFYEEKLASGQIKKPNILQASDPSDSHEETTTAKIEKHMVK